MAYSALQLADAFIRTGELQDALDALGDHLTANPLDEEALRLRAAVLLRTQNADQYRAALDDLSQLSEPTADDWVQRSILWQALGDWGEANTAMEQAHDLQPAQDRITERYLLTLEKSGQPEAARDLLENLPKTWRWLQIAGDIAAGMQDNTAAESCYAAAVADLETRLDTDSNPFAANLKAVLLLKQQSLTPGA